MSLGELWTLMEQQPAPRGLGRMERSAHAGVTCTVLAALCFPGADRALVIRLPEAEARALVNSGLTSSIEVTLNATTSQTGQASVLLRTRDPRHRDLFGYIGDDLVEQLRREMANPVHALLTRIELWREFLRRRDETLTEPRVRGLFGEVWFLSEYLIPRTEPHNEVAAIAAWTGPLGARRDFNLGEASLDMKTGVPGSMSVQISSIQQLSPSPGTNVYLGYLTLRSDPAGQTLPDLIDHLRSVLIVEARELLDSRLLRAGYMDADRDTNLLRDLRFVADHFNTYAISPDFPALTSETVPSAIIACSYTLDLGACSAFSVNPHLIPGIGETH